MFNTTICFIKRQVQWFRLAFIAVSLFALPSFAQDDSGILDSGVLDAGETAIAGTTTSVAVAPAVGDAGASLVTTTTATTVQPLTALDDHSAFLKIIVNSVKSGDGWSAAAAFLVLIVGLLRAYGKKLHDWLDDTNPLDKIFWFFFETKPGGWLLNFLMATAGAIGTSLLASEPITWALLKPILIVALTGAGLWEIVGDLVSWIKAKTAKPAPVVAAPPLTNTPPAVEPVVPPVEPPKS